MKYVITDCGKVIEELTYSGFTNWYYQTFGYDCGSPVSVIDNLSENQMVYVGRGLSVTAVPDPKVDRSATYCGHPKKYTQRFQTFEFDYCPDCKKEV